MRQLITRLFTTFRLVRAILAALAIVTLITSGLSLPRAYSVLARPRGALLTPRAVGLRVLALANRYRAPSTLDGPPTFRDRELPVPWLGGVCRRVFWQASVHTDGQTLDLFINDRTGNLMCAYNTSDLAECSAPAPAGSVSIDSPIEAVRRSLLEARKLQLIPPHCEAALAGAPERHGCHEMWRVEWKVRRLPGAAPYRVVVILQGKSGRLLSVTNSEELGSRIGRLN